MIYGAGAGYDQAAAHEVAEDPFTLQWRDEAGRRTRAYQQHEADHRADPYPYPVVHQEHPPL